MYKVTEGILLVQDLGKMKYKRSIFFKIPKIYETKINQVGTRVTDF